MSFESVFTGVYGTSRFREAPLSIAHIVVMVAEMSTVYGRAFNGSSHKTVISIFKSSQQSYEEGITEPVTMAT